MPERMLRPCSTPGCPELTTQGKCEQHRRAEAKRHDNQRGTRKQRGYDETWLRLRRLVLKQEPLCRICLSQGKVVSAAEVDHITPIAKGGARLDMENLQPLCKSCHSRKTVAEDGGFGHG